jgi:hypothetical protein
MTATIARATCPTFDAMLVKAGCEDQTETPSPMIALLSVAAMA